MAFTYTGDLTTDLDSLRFMIGDTVSGAGGLPDSTNIPNATLNAILASVLKVVPHDVRHRERRGGVTR